MRQIITKGLYILFVEMIATYLIVFPVYAFNVAQSSTGYVRVATSTAVTVYQGAQRAVFTNAVATAMASASPVSVAVRIATGPVGWTALGVSAALTLASMYYSQSKVAAVKTAALAAQPPVIAISGWTPVPGATLVPGFTCSPLTYGCTQLLNIPNARTQAVCTAIGQTPVTPVPPGWSGGPQWPSGGPCIDSFFYQYFGNPGPLAVTSPPTTMTQSAAQTYVQSLPSSSPNSIESNTSPIGQGATAPVAENVTTLPVSPTDVVPTVKPAAQVVPTDAVIDPNAPAPAGPQVATLPTTSTTKTTTSTTNPDGSVTETETSPTGTISCNTGNHESRTFGSVLQDHMNVWQGSGLLSALNVLKTLTWPTTPPAYTLTSPTWGTHTIDFVPWAGMLTALRTIIIALASFVAYRIVFVGSK